jgi:CheY-like chemotaxis protein
LRARARNRPAGLRRLQGMRLLVVEDNLVNQQVARELLQAEGALVELAENGQLGVAAVAAAKPPFDAVLMDIQMPVMDGFGATRAIRQQLGLTSLPIVAMTANAMTSDREECLQAGMNDHVGKPFDLAYLVKVLLQVSGFQPQPNTVTLAQLPLPLAAPVALATATAAVPAVTAAPAPPAKSASALDIDLENALDRLDGMSDLYIALAGEFVTELHAVDGQYRQSLLAGLPDQAARQMHTLKGTAATLGAMELSALAAQLETLCKAAQTEAALGRADALQSMVQASIAALDRASAQLQQAGG